MVLPRWWPLSPRMPLTLRLPGGLEDEAHPALYLRAHQQSVEDSKPADGAVASPADRGKETEEAGSAVD